LPAGLGVWIVNDRAIEKYRKKVAAGKVTGSYHDLGQLLKKDKEHQTPETPNMLTIYLLGKVAEDMNNRGIKMIQNETRYKSTLLYQVLENHELIAPFISEKKNRSHTVIVGDMKDNADLLKYMQEKKIILGKGYGSYKSTHIRIANFPAHSKEQIEMLVDLIEGWANGK
jgi:phosphoserine aminotransferase